MSTNIFTSFQIERARWHLGSKYYLNRKVCSISRIRIAIWKIRVGLKWKTKMNDRGEMITKTKHNATWWRPYVCNLINSERHTRSWKYLICYTHANPCLYSCSREIDPQASARSAISLGKSWWQISMSSSHMCAILRHMGDILNALCRQLLLS